MESRDPKRKYTDLMFLNDEFIFQAGGVASLRLRF